VARYKKSGSGARENRGGDRVGTKNSGRKKKIKEFISKLRARESHYGRNKSMRLYLPNSLRSFNNLRNLYNASVETSFRVSYTPFHRIFVRDFNIGFSSPASDTCTTCDSLKNQIRVCTAAEKNVLIMQLRVHKLRSKAFYQQLRQNNPETYTIVYDLQQVHTLPKVTCQEAFYSRQLSLYNFGLCDQSKKKNVSYTWTENQSGRGSNEIASAVHHYLSEVVQGLNPNDGFVKFRLVSDGCGGQNKNNIILGMAMSFLMNAPQQIESMELLFPVRGHSLLPCDRLFGRIKKELKTHDSILEPSGYHDVFSHHCSSVYKYGIDWKVGDWKAATSKLYKPLEKIQEAKHIVLVRSREPMGITVRCEANYRCDTAVPVNLLKRGQRHCNLKVFPISAEKEVSAAKLKDIHNLLRVAYGPKWNKLPGAKIYTELKCALQVPEDNIPHKDCDCADEEISFRV